MEDGSSKDLGIKELFNSAKEVREIYHPSPLVIGSIHRILAAILQRVLDTRTLDSLAAIWEDDEWDIDAINAYLDEWTHRFELFDKKRPFYQIADFKEGKPVTVNKLALEMSAGNNTILFDHHFDELKEPMPPEVVARLLVACQNYSVGGGKSSTVNFRHSPLVGKAQVLLRGDSLFETLNLNLIRYDEQYPMRFTGMEREDKNRSDRPAWETDLPETPGETRNVLGYLDYLTWQSRCVNLVTDGEDEDGVTSMFFAQGAVMADDDILEPMAAYREVEKRGLIPIGIYQNKEPWRNLVTLVQMSDSAHRPAGQVKAVADMVSDGVLSSKRRYEMDVVGICSDQAKVHLWRHARMPLPAAYLASKDLVKNVEEAIGFAEDIQRVLSGSAYLLAKELLTFTSESPPDKDSVRNLLKSFGLEQDYWAGLEAHFYRFLEDQAKASENDDYAAMDSLMISWCKDTIALNAKRRFEKLVADTGTDARGMRASVKAKTSFYNKLNKAVREMEERYDIGKGSGAA